MSLIKTVREKVAEGASLKDCKHIVKRHKEGKALNNFYRYCEEIVVAKMLADGKKAEAIIAATAVKEASFEDSWTEKRLSKLQTRLEAIAKKKAAKPKKEKKAPAAPKNPKKEKAAAPKAEKPAKAEKKEVPAAPATEAPAPEKKD